MKIWQAIVLGIIQGLTEFLPVSSSGHLVLFTHILGCPQNMFFDVLLHIGTLVPLVVVFRAEIFKTIKSIKKLFFLVIATIPAGLAGYFFGDKIEEAFSVEFLPAAFVFTAAILFISEKFGSKKRRNIGFGSACFYGIMQTFALLPGISRSGSCLSAGNFLGIRGEENSDFAFMMSLPVITASFALEAVGIKTFGFSAAYIIGTIAACVSGFIALILMKKIAKSGKYSAFSVYLLLLAAAIILFS